MNANLLNPATLPDARLAALHAMAVAEIERGHPESMCTCATWELLAMTAELIEHRSVVAVAGRGTEEAKA
jgi:hypothetical protein